MMNITSLRENRVLHQNKGILPSPFTFKENSTESESVGLMMQVPRQGCEPLAVKFIRRFRMSFRVYLLDT